MAGSGGVRRKDEGLEELTRGKEGQEGREKRKKRESSLVEHFPRARYLCTFSHLDFLTCLLVSSLVPLQSILHMRATRASHLHVTV